jgi:hypothetical protein
MVVAERDTNEARLHVTRPMARSIGAACTVAAFLALPVAASARPASRPAPPPPRVVFKAPPPRIVRVPGGVVAALYG